MASVNPRAHDIVAHMPGVKAAVRGFADAGAARARLALAQHGKTGNTDIEVKTNVTDTIVSLTNPKPWAAVSIELGHRKKGGGHVEGLHILGRAFGV